MKSIIFYSVISLSLFSMSNGVFAEDYYSSQTPNGGYYSSQSQGSSSSNYYSNQHEKKSRFSISVNLPGPVIEQNDTYFVKERYHHRRYKEIAWIDMMQGQPLPPDAVVGGFQPVPRATLFVCRANYNGGLHPGKLYDGRCNIGWGGDEVSLPQYQVLVSRSRLHWIPSSDGRLPPNAIQAGYQQDGPLYVCQARYRGGMHTGKIYGQNCNIGWGGKEILIPYYNVLVG